MQTASELIGAALDTWRDSRPAPRVLGICGAQGCGKSTVSAALARRMSERGLRTAVLSLDDLYVSRTARRRLAQSIHPLYATRGVPGTHRVDLGIRLLDDLIQRQVTPLPRFDKAIDGPLERSRWPAFAGPADLVIFEGWCVGAIAQTADELAVPVNDLERIEDPDGTWRAAVNSALQGGYAQLFSRIDRLVLLAAPDFSVVERWRTQQEHALLAKRIAAGDGTGHMMSDAGIARFIQHFERLTRGILLEMPARADLTLLLDADRRVIGISGPNR